MRINLDGKTSFILVVIGVIFWFAYSGSIDKSQQKILVKESKSSQKNNDPETVGQELLISPSIQSKVDNASSIEENISQVRFEISDSPDKGFQLKRPDENTPGNNPLPEREPIELDVVSNQLIMSFTEGFQGYSREEKDALLAPYGVRILKEFPYAGGSVVLEITGAPDSKPGKLPEGETKEQVHQRINTIVEQLQELNFVKYAKPDVIVQTTSVPNDPRYNELWGLQNIQAEQAWDYIEQNNPGSTDIIIGVIDTGVDYTHPDLADNMWVNPGEIAGNGVDDDGNGYIDDIYGLDTYNDDSDPMDDNNHGTHVAGTIGAVRDNNQGIVGVLPNVKIIALKFLGADGSGSTSGAIELLNYVYAMKQLHGVDIRLTNNSWGGTVFDQALYDAFAVSSSLDILTVAAAGNSSSNADYVPHYPAAYDLDSIISVAAIDNSNQLASFSNFGETTVDIAAPGVSILSTTPGNSYAVFNGTSMATPHVSGVIGLLLSSEPTLTISQTRERLFSRAEVIPDKLAGRIATSAKINAYDLLKADLFEVDTLGNEPFLVPEGGNATFNIRLKNGVALGQSITAAIELSGDSDIGVDIPVSLQLSFNDTNRDEWQQVTVSALDDSDGVNQITNIKVSAGMWAPINIIAIEQDDDDPLEICNSVTSVPASECEALVKLYLSTDGHQWSDSTNWLDSDPCGWARVQCDSEGHISRLNFLGNFLSGTIPPELGNLTHLTYLDFSANQLVGPIPPELGDLTNLGFLLLSVNQLSGSIPPELSNLKELELIALNSNLLTGPIPPGLGDLDKLYGIEFTNNSLSGSIPTELGSMDRLQHINLGNNNFTGTIPTELGNLPLLSAVDIRNSQLTGSIPKELGNSDILNFVYLGGNQLTGNIPVELATPNLRNLFLQNNQLTGNIPSALGSTKLTFANLSGNQLTGSIPSELSNLVNMTTLYLDNNELTGSIPSELGNLTKLTQLYLQKNKLTGNIPVELGKLNNIDKLLLEGNGLTGEIPISFPELSPDNLKLNFNALYSTNEDVQAFLSSYSASSWTPSFQTVLPSNIQLLSQNGQLVFNWDQQSRLGTGGYIISYSDARDGVYSEHGRTQGTQYIIEDASEYPQRFYKVQNYSDPTPNNKFEIASEYSRSFKIGVDTVPPVISISGEVILEATDNIEADLDELRNQLLLLVSAVDDNDGIVTNITVEELTNLTLGINYITLIACDNSNNCSSVIYRFTVKDISPPIISVTNILLEATAPLTNVNLSTPTVTDNFDTNLSVTSDNTGPFPVGTHIITWTATDSSGNTGTATQTVTIQDTTAPTLTVPEAITIEASALLTPLNLGIATASDLVEGALNPQPSAVGPFAVGTHIITWTATDGSGNTEIATQTVTIQDTTAPTLTIPEAITKEASALLTPVNLGIATAIDIVDGTLNPQPSTIGPFALGTHTIIWIVKDASGNTTTATQQITITDTTPSILTDRIVDLRFDDMNLYDCVNQYTQEQQWKFVHEVTSLICINENIANANGLEQLGNLKNLELTDNQLTLLDLTPLTQLTHVNVGYNQLQSLNITGLSQLRVLGAWSNQLTSLDVAALTQLTNLHVDKNQLSTLDVSALTQLQTLHVGGNQLSALDVSSLTQLQQFWAYNNALTTLDVVNLTQLVTLHVSDNQLASLDVSNLAQLTYLNASNNQLSTLDVSQLTQLTKLYTANNQLTVLDVANLTELIDLYANNNQLSLLDVSQSQSLVALGAWSNQLTTLQLPTTSALVRLHVDKNQLTSLDVSNLVNLVSLHVANNQLVELDVSQMTRLRYLWAYNNQLQALDVSNLTNLQNLIATNNELSTLDVSDLTQLQWLRVANNQLVGLDTTNLVQLKGLDVSNNQLQVLDVSQLDQLLFLFVNNNQLTQLDVSNLSNLDYFTAWSNQLGFLDVSALTKLTRLHVDKNNLTSLDVGNLVNLTSLNVANNQLSTLDLSALVNLRRVYAGNNELNSLTTPIALDLIYLDVSRNQLQQLDTSGLLGLTSLKADNNQLTTLDVSGLVALTYLNVDHNQLTTLAVDNFVNLTHLYATYNQLQQLNVTNLVNLVAFQVWSNQLTTLDVSALTKLTRLHVDKNQLTELDVSNLVNLTSLNVANNNLTELDVSALVNLVWLNTSNNPLL